MKEPSPSSSGASYEAYVKESSSKMVYSCISSSDYLKAVLPEEVDVSNVVLQFYHARKQEVPNFRRSRLLPGLMADIPPTVEVLVVLWREQGGLPNWNPLPLKDGHRCREFGLVQFGALNQPPRVAFNEWNGKHRVAVLIDEGHAVFMRQFDDPFAEFLDEARRQHPLLEEPYHWEMLEHQIVVEDELKAIVAQHPDADASTLRAAIATFVLRAMKGCVQKHKDGAEPKGDSDTQGRKIDASNKKSGRYF